MPAFIDLTGQRFGHQLVVRRVENKGTQAAWLVRCDCGNERVMRTGEVRKTQRCQECNALPINRRMRDLTGQRFGQWQVDEVAEIRHGHSFWHVTCDCGNIGVVVGTALTQGTTSRCRDCAVALNRTIPRPGRRRHGDDEVTYEAVHMRLRRERGAASTHLCVQCGEQARDWAYQHDDPGERIGPVTSQDGKTYMLSFTANLDAYKPMCILCHVRFDKGLT